MHVFLALHFRLWVSIDALGIVTLLSAHVATVIWTSQSGLRNKNHLIIWHWHGHLFTAACLSQTIMREKKGECAMRAFHWKVYCACFISVHMNTNK